MSMMALEEMVAENSYERLVDMFVEALPVDKLGFTNSALEKEGPTVIISF